MAFRRSGVRTPSAPPSGSCPIPLFVLTFLRNLSHPDEFILRAKVAGERRIDVQVNQIHRTADQITDPRSHAVEKRRGQARNRQVEIEGGVTRPFGSGAKNVNFPSASGFEFGGGALDQNVCLGAHAVFNGASFGSEF